MAGIAGISSPFLRNLVEGPPRSAGNGPRNDGTRLGAAESPLIDGPAAVVDFSPEAQSLIESQEQADEDSLELDEAEQAEVEELRQRDREVRAHESAHSAAAGQYAQGGPQYEFTRGPDGRQYATGGHVNIDVSAESTPEATIAKARIVRRAALAPAEPSPADRAVAAAASQLETEARRELREAESAALEDAGSSPLDASREDGFRQATEEFAPAGRQAGPSRLDILV